MKNDKVFTPTPWSKDFHGHIVASNGTNVASTWTAPDENYPEGRPYNGNGLLIAAAVNSYAAHTLDPIAAAESDLLGQLFDALQEAQRWIKDHNRLVPRIEAVECLNNVSDLLEQRKV